LDAAELAFAGPLRQAELIRDGEISPRELVQVYLDRIERIDPQLNAFRIVLAERALTEAKQAGRRKTTQERPLLGVPFAIKDNHDLTGEVTTHGTGAYDRTPAKEDAEIVRRLRAAGAIPIGKTLLPELAIWPFTESATWGVTRNPWDVDRTPAGSSGGSAAAVAAGLASFATASDGGGSIRLPAANCRLFGLKPQRGRVSLLPDAEHWHGLSVAGVHTVSVRDQAAIFDVIAGPAPGDADTPPAWERPLAEAAAAPPGKLRVAVATNAPMPGVKLADACRRAVDETGGLLRSLGHEVTEHELDFGMIITTSFSPRYAHGIRQDIQRLPRPDRLERRTRAFKRLGALAEPFVQRARRLEAEYGPRLLGVFDDHDVVVTPMTARPPVEVMRWEGLGAPRAIDGIGRTYPYAAVWNVIGNPAASVPALLDDDGLPVAVQLVARPNDEPTVVSLAAQIESERPWSDTRPAIAA
jgi:amidase